MKKLALLALCSSALFAQTSETIPFRALMTTANEVPATDILASGSSTVLVHVMRNAAGQIVSGSVDFRVDYIFPGAATFTGLHLHDGAAGVNGPVTVNTGISGAAPVSGAAAGRGLIDRQAQVLATDAVGLATLNRLMQDPSQVYINLHTTVFPGGAIRGQLQRAEAVVLIGLMSPQNEVPAITNLAASAVASVWAVGTRSASGQITSAQVTFDLNYDFVEDVSFTGFHIHKGAAGENGPITINPGFENPTQAVRSGIGNFRLAVEVPLNNAAAVETFEGLFNDPGSYYVNLHSTAFPGGTVRGQLRRTDITRFPVQMRTGNEVPPPVGLQASAVGEVTVYSVRNSDGTAAAATLRFDVNTRFSETTEFTGLNIHDGLAGTTGPVRITTLLSDINPTIVPTGFGNVYKLATVSDVGGLATLNSLLRNPENHYVSIRGELFPGGAVRAQLAEPNLNRPAVTAVISAVSDSSMKVVAPGGLMTIFGSNLSKVVMESGGNPPTGGVPASINGTKITLGGKDARLMVVSPNYIVAYVPADVAPGTHALNATNTNGDAAVAFAVTVAAVAPALFFDATGGIVTQNSDFSLIRPDNPARSGNILLIYSTGLGLTTPGAPIGQILTYPPPSHTAPVTVTVGGQDASVIYSIASPGYLGLYQTAIRMPAGVTAGNVPVALRIAGTTSNTVNIAVQ